MAHFVLAEIHPFKDGNGRIWRFGLNAELDASRKMRLVVPTSLRGDSLTVLDAFNPGSKSRALGGVLPPLAQAHGKAGACRRASIGQRSGWVQAEDSAEEAWVHPRIIFPLVHDTVRPRVSAHPTPMGTAAPAPDQDQPQSQP